MKMLPTRTLMAVLQLALTSLLIGVRHADARTNATIVVNTNSDSVADNCVMPNLCSLRSAIALAGTDGTVKFAGNYTITLGSPLVIAFDRLKVDAAVDSRDVRINANQSGQVFRIESDGAELHGLRVFNAGAGTSEIYITGRSKNVVLVGNSIGSGERSHCSHDQISSVSYGGVYVGATTSVLAAGEARVTLRDNMISCHSGTPGEGVTIAGVDGVRVEYTSLLGGEIRENKVGIKMEAGSLRNTISGAWIRYNQAGVVMEGANDNDITGSIIEDNYGHGISITNGQRNLIGGRRSVFNGNIVAVNAGDGIRISGGGQNYVTGNDIGWAQRYEGYRTPAVVKNTGNGITIDGSSANEIGSSADGNDYRNYISNNGVYGIKISGTSQNNLIKGNFIGTNLAVTGALPNASSGIVLDGANVSNNFIGAASTDTSAGGDTGNVISGNDYDGVEIVNGAHHNIVSGNNIGTNGPLSTPGIGIANLSGVSLKQGAHNNSIGNVSSDTFQNYIAGNQLNGVYIGDATTTNNSVGGNQIGYISTPALIRGVADPVPVTITNGSDGIILTAGAHHNNVKFAVLRANASGIYVTGGANNNTIENVYAKSNRIYGILLDGATTTGNVITNTLADFNGADGIADRNNATGNVWRRIGTVNNGGLGIDRNASTDAGNAITAPPPAPAVRKLNATQYVVTVTLGSAADAGTISELYIARRDSSGYGEGAAYVGEASRGLLGPSMAVFTVTSPNSPCFTVMTISAVLPNQSSEFSQTTCTSQPAAFLPMLRR